MFFYNTKKSIANFQYVKNYFEEYWVIIKDLLIFVLRYMRVAYIYELCVIWKKHSLYPIKNGRRFKIIHRNTLWCNNRSIFTGFAKQSKC
ncbi:MAG: hypothetical protein EAZ85_06170 [Bacteroidetes bacterium]|nr:MAG: hypothetical protein EAZ85_06170 [Bacteroidota bacterium]TAG89888.1 MAG: hypothetical protein EAZ20_05545 [Bacteroidota bacterium]